VEGLISTIRREYLDHLLFWTTADLENKLLDFRTYFNNIARIPHEKGERPICRCHTNRQSPLVSMATPLPILVSHPTGCLTLQILGLTAVSGQPRSTSKEIIRFLYSQLQVLVR
jgi:hypothetical protein